MTSYYMGSRSRALRAARILDALIRVATLTGRQEAELIAGNVARFEADNPAEVAALDFTYFGGGSVYIFTPQNEEARAHLRAHVDDSAQWLGNGLAVEAPYVGPLIEALQAAGFAVWPHKMRRF